MDYILSLELWEGLILVVGGTSFTGIAFYYVIRRSLRSHLKKNHEKVGRLLFRVTASLIALLISLTFANENIAYNKLVDSMVEETSTISNVFIKLEMYNTEQTEEIRNGIIEYVRLIIDDNWKNTIANPYFSRANRALISLNKSVFALPEKDNLQKNLKLEIIQDMHEIFRASQIRIYSSSFHIPALIYILIVGMFIVWCFYSVYPFDKISVLFISLYNLFIAVVLYFVILLGNPLSGPLKIDPVPFKVLEEKGLLDLNLNIDK
jgi:hypothetical protein